MSDQLEELKRHIPEWKVKQNEFIDWLKSRNLYEPYASCEAMRRMQRLWEYVREESRLVGRAVHHQHGAVDGSIICHESDIDAAVEALFKPHGSSEEDSTDLQR